MSDKINGQHKNRAGDSSQHKQPQSQSDRLSAILAKAQIAILASTGLSSGIANGGEASSKPLKQDAELVQIIEPGEISSEQANACCGNSSCSCNGSC